MKVMMTVNETVLHYDIYYYLIQYLDLDTFKRYSLLNKEIQYICKVKRELISKNFLKKYSVEYTDPCNFIYLYNKKTMLEYMNSDGEWMYAELLKLYMKTYNLYFINCSKMGITSFPIYPNMEYFLCDRNNLKYIPVQPKMKRFMGINNLLEKFLTQPEMVYFSGPYNELKEFSVQPKMEVFYGYNNLLESFPSQPEMVCFYGSNNNITEFATQPKMKVYNGDIVDNFDIQPKLELFNDIAISERNFLKFN